jgi:TRAP-type C4-dicarboxylate transport system substrate-binding protein
LKSKRTDRIQIMQKGVKKTLKKLLFISLAVVLALSMALVGCGENGVVLEYDLTIASSDGGSVFPAAGTHTYQQGQVVNVKATPASEFYEFVNWTGPDADQLGDANAAETSITMNGDYSIQANFQALPWDDTITLTFHATISDRASIVEFVFKPFIEELKGLTGSQGGAFDVVETYGDAPFDATASLSAISAGTVDMGQLSGDTYHLGGIGFLPFLFPDMESAAYATYHLFTEGNGKWDAAGELSDVKILITTPLWGMQWWGNVDVRVPDDVAGVKVRSEANEGLALLALGAVPVNLGTSDLGSALQTGIVDGCFFTYSGIGGFSGVGPNTDYTTELNLYYRSYSLAMNREVYEGLPAEARQALDSITGADASVTWAANHKAGEADAKDETISGPMFPPPAHPEWGRVPYEPTPAELQLWYDATGGVADEWATYMTDTLGFDGQGILARAEALIAEAP